MRAHQAPYWMSILFCRNLHFEWKAAYPYGNVQIHTWTCMPHAHLFLCGLWWLLESFSIKVKCSQKSKSFRTMFYLRLKKNVLKEQKYKVKVVSFHCSRPAFLSMLMREAVMTNSPQTSCFTMNGALLLMPYVFSRPQSNSRETRRLRMTFRFNCCC